MAKVPKHIAEIAAKLYADENGAHWTAIGEHNIAPSEVTGVAMFTAILLRGAELHQNVREAAEVSNG